MATMMHRASLALSWLVADASSVFLQPAEQPGHFSEECHVAMQNNDEVDYTVQLDIGGQTVSVIPDTGSFAMVLFSDLCESCGKRKNLLHPDKLKHLKTGAHRAVQNYGSGDTYSADAYAPAQVQCKGNSTGPGFIRASKQMFWMTVKANLPVAEESHFQGILGLGPPRSDEKMASAEAAEATREVAEMKSRGMDVDEYKPLVENLEDVARFTKTVKPWLENNGLNAFSVCLRSGPGQEGTLIYNDRRPLEEPEMFASMATDKSGPYWQTSLGGVQLGSSKDAYRIRTSGKTQAILDTGTSLIGAPSWFVQGVVAFVSARLPDLGCDDVSKWPDLGFTLGGVELALPASSYLGKLVGDFALVEASPRLHARMPHLKNGTSCTAMIFSTSDDDAGAAADSDADERTYVQEDAATGIEQALGDSVNPDWIFGLPFFRTYYTTFLLSKNAMDARRILVAEADETCGIKGRPGHSSETTVQEVRVPAQHRPLGPMAVDPRKLRLPPRGALRRKGQSLQAARELAGS